MSKQQKEIDPEIRSLIEKKANENSVPPKLLFDIYQEERRVVNMDHRQDIHTNVQELIKEYGKDWSPPE